MTKRIGSYTSLVLALILVPATSQARWLNPDTGRFQTMDDYEGNQSEPISLHKYNYAHGNPVNITDQSGHFVVEALVTLSIVTILAVTLTGCSSDPIPAAAMLVVADPSAHGRTFEMAAHTHKREIERGGIWESPVKSGTKMEVVDARTVSQFVNQLKGRKLSYLAYFGHAHEDALYFGMVNAPDTNLSDNSDPNSTPVSVIPPGAFSKDAAIRIFGCRAGYGNNSIAQSIASQVKKPVWAYTNPRGALFTDDPVLGHGGRTVTPADVYKFDPQRGGRVLPYNPNTDLWLVPNAPGNSPTWKTFTP